MEQTFLKDKLTWYMFTTVLLTISEIWKKPKCSSLEKMIKKSWSVCTMEYNSAM